MHLPLPLTHSLTAAPVLLNALDGANLLPLEELPRAPLPGTVSRLQAERFLDPLEEEDEDEDDEDEEDEDEDDDDFDDDDDDDDDDDWDEDEDEDENNRWRPGKDGGDDKDDDEDENDVF